jgi:hypothetical protein
MELFALQKQAKDVHLMNRVIIIPDGVNHQAHVQSALRRSPYYHQRLFGN